MTHGQRFQLDGITYYVDTVGPVTTLCKREDGTFEHFQTYALGLIINTLAVE